MDLSVGAEQRLALVFCVIAMVVRTSFSSLRSRNEVVLENLALRRQLAVFEAHLHDPVENVGHKPRRAQHGQQQGRRQAHRLPRRDTPVFRTLETSRQRAEDHVPIRVPWVVQHRGAVGVLGHRLRGVDLQFDLVRVIFLRPELQGQLVELSSLSFPAQLVSLQDLRLGHVAPREQPYVPTAAAQARQHEQQTAEG